MLGLKDCETKMRFQPKKEAQISETSFLCNPFDPNLATAIHITSLHIYFTLFQEIDIDTQYIELI